MYYFIAFCLYKTSGRQQQQLITQRLLKRKSERFGNNFHQLNSNNTEILGKSSHNHIKSTEGKKERNSTINIPSNSTSTSVLSVTTSSECNRNHTKDKKSKQLHLSNNLHSMDFSVSRALSSNNVYSTPRPRKRRRRAVATPEVINLVSSADEAIYESNQVLKIHNISFLHFMA